jgi:hypothetical protein
MACIWIGQSEPIFLFLTKIQRWDVPISHETIAADASTITLIKNTIT